MGGGTGVGWGPGAGVVGDSLFDEALCLLSAQKGTWPTCHGLDQALLLLAVTQGHGLNPAGDTAVRVGERPLHIRPPPRLGPEKGPGKCPMVPTHRSARSLGAWLAAEGLSLPDRLPESEALLGSPFSWEEVWELELLSVSSQPPPACPGWGLRTVRDKTGGEIAAGGL